MRIEKFTVAKVECKANIAKLYKFGDWKQQHPELRREFFYTITAEDGRIFYFHVWKKKRRISVGQVIGCFAKQHGLYGGTGSKNEYSIEYHTLYGDLLNRSKLNAAIDDYAERARKHSEFELEEKKRLESLKEMAASPEAALTD